MTKQNWFPTLNAALESEGLLHAWDISFSPIAYGQTFGWTWDNGTKHGHYISVYRNDVGLYERPINYSRN